MSEESVESAKLALEASENKDRDGKHATEKWVEWASLSTMVMALASAVGGLMAGKTANEAIIERQKQITELLRVNRMELESELLLTRLAVVTSTGGTPEPSLLERIESANDVLSESSEKAYKDVEESQAALQAHELFAIATTILSVAITITGMAVVVRRKNIWYLGICIGVLGAAVLANGVQSL